MWILFLDTDGTVQAQQKISNTQGGFQGNLGEYDLFGCSLAALGDLDGDGVNDLAVGAYGFGDSGASPGAVWILFLDTDGTVKAQQKISAVQGGFTGDLDAGDELGTSVAALGDLDGDGTTDLAAGAESDDDGGSDSGAVWFLFLDAAGTVEAQRKISATEGGFTGALAQGDRFGASLSGSDRDADGLADLAVGAPYDDDGGVQGIFSHGALWLLELDGIASLDFESGDDLARTPLVNGQSVSSPGGFGRVLEIASSGPNLGPAIFDSAPGGPNDPGPDPDLLVDRNNLLILQDSLAPTQTAPGIFDAPDDDQDGGRLVLTFHARIEPLSIDLVDVDGHTGEVARVTLYDENDELRRYSIPPGWTGDLVANGPPGWRRLDLTTLAPQPGFVTGTHAARPKLRPYATQIAVTAIESAGFAPRNVVRIEVELGSSGAIDLLRWNPHTGL